MFCGGNIILPAGSYKVFLNNGDNMLINSVIENQPLTEMMSDESLYNSVIGIQKIKTLENCQFTNGQLNGKTEVVSGEGDISLIVSDVKMKKNKACCASITFRGTVKEAELASYDVSYSDFKNASTTEFEELENHLYRMKLIFTPSYSRDKNEFVFKAVFEGAFEIIDFSLK